MELKFVVDNKGELNEEERDFLKEAYRNFFIQIKGLDVFDSFLFVTNIPSKFYKNEMKHLSENYRDAIDALNLVKENDLVELILIYNKSNNALVGAARSIVTGEYTIQIPDIVIDGVTREEELEIFEQSLLYLEQYYAELGFKKIYIEIPCKDFVKLSWAFSMGYQENPEDIIVNEEQRTSFLNKSLERVIDEEPNNHR